MQDLFGGIYRNKTILLTGHLGFKGSWLALWLQAMGARVVGFSLDLPSEPAHAALLDLDWVSIKGDIRDPARVEELIQQYKPEMVFHLAAQALVRYSYAHPLETFSSNIMGTANLLEAARKCDSVKAFLSVTSDKAYENREWVWGYRENDPMGGYDPYSASKGCAELITSSYQNSFYQHTDKLLASARAGNVIGGGDWALDRLVPDIFRAAARGETVEIRFPHATRPWQHVLEPLSGYLLLGQQLLLGNRHAAEAWNFGPGDEDVKSVGEVVKAMAQHWEAIRYRLSDQAPQLHEANLLKLDCSKARSRLAWRPVWDFAQTIRYTSDWYRDFYSREDEDVRARSMRDLACYVSDAAAKGLAWAL